MEEQQILTIPAQSSIKGPSPIIGYAVTTIQRAHRIVGEERNIADAYCTGVTRHLPKKFRRHLLSSGDPGVGKTTVMEASLSPFGKDVVRVSRVTGAGLDRGESLDGKILYLEQLVGQEPIQILFLMSEGKLSLISAERDEKSGKVVSKQQTIEGMPVVTSTTIGSSVEGQYASRTSTQRIDESEAQTVRISKRKLTTWATVDHDDPEQLIGRLAWLDGKCRELGKSVRAIKAPWALSLEEKLPKVLAMRRGLDKILNLMGAICFIKSSVGLRPIVKEKIATGIEEAYLIATPEDLDDAIWILGKEIADSISFFLGRSREVFNWLKENPASTSKDASIGLHMSQTRAGEYLKSLTDFEHATREKVGSTYHYTATVDSEPTLELSASYDLTQLPKWVKDNFSMDHAQLLLPDRDIQPSVVFVESLPEPVFDSAKPIVSITGTINSAVSGSTLNNGLDGHDEDTGYDLTLKTLRSIDTGFWSYDYMVERVGKAVQDTTIAKGYLEVLARDGVLVQRSDGYWQLSTGLTQ
jgi:hypothetical protein